MQSFDYSKCSHSVSVDQTQASVYLSICMVSDTVSGIVRGRHCWQLSSITDIGETSERLDILALLLRMSVHRPALGVIVSLSISQLPPLVWPPDCPFNCRSGCPFGWLVGCYGHFLSSYESIDRQRWRYFRNITMDVQRHVWMGMEATALRMRRDVGGFIENYQHL